MGKKSFSHLGEVRIDFFFKIECCFNEIQYQATKRRHYKQSNWDVETLSLAKSRDCETHITAIKTKLRYP